MKKALSVLAIAVAFTGCVHHSPFQSEYYFQAMGRDGEIVVTADASRVKEGNAELGSNPVMERTERINVALMPDESGTYPLPIENWTLYGALEGNFGKVLVPMAIGSMDGFEKVSIDGGKYYSNGKISMGVPETGILLFSTGDYEEAKERTLDKRSLLIPSKMADLMASSLFAIYVKSPRTMIDLGFDLPFAVLSSMNYAIISVDTSDSVHYMSATVDFSDERSAKTFSVLMRNLAVQRIRRAGERLDIKALSDMIRQEGSSVLILNKVMEDEEFSKYLDIVSSFSGGIV